MLEYADAVRSHRTPAPLPKPAIVREDRIALPGCSAGSGRCSPKSFDVLPPAGPKTPSCTS